jgi:hypothetical protein
MSECVWHDVTLALPLQSIVANGGSRLQGGFDIAGLDESPLCLGAIRPDARQAICLQLNPDLKCIGVGLFDSLLCLLYLRQDAKLVLHVMPDFVSDYIGLRKLAGFASDVTTAETLLKVSKKACVEVHFLVDWAVEWAHRSLGESAARLSGAGKHDKRWRLVRPSGLIKDFLPLYFRAAENGGHKAAHFVRRRPRSGFTLLLRLTVPGHHLGAPDENTRINAQCPTDQTKYDNRAYSDTGVGGRDAASILYLIARWQLVETHDGTSARPLHIMIVAIPPDSAADRRG